MRTTPPVLTSVLPNTSAINHYSAKLGEIIGKEGVPATSGTSSGSDSQQPLSDALQVENVKLNLVGFSQAIVL